MSDRTRRRVLYLPIETKARELYGKTLLAARAAERGWQVILGPQEAVHEALRHGPPGVFIEMSLPESRAPKLAKYRSFGHRIASMCEESVVYYDPVDYCNRKAADAAIAEVDILLVVGANTESNLGRLRPASRDKLRLTGNPRFDTLSVSARIVYEAATAPLRARFGNFLLVNTNFMRTNHFKRSPEELIEGLRRDNAILDDAHAEMVRRQYAYKGEQMELLKPVLAAIASAGHFANIILRPHPSENHDSWREWAAPHGIKVIYEGTANEWMLASEAILHTGCTTAIEGVLLDRPAASFQPVRGHELLNQADMVSEPFTTAEEFMALAGAWRNADAATRRAFLLPQREAVGGLIANTQPPPAVDRIVDALDKLDVVEAPTDVFHRSTRNPFALIASRVRGQLKGRIGAYHRQKFPGLAADEIASPCAAWVGTGVLTRPPELAELPDGTWLFT